MVKIKIDDLNEVDYNPRKITQKELEKLKQSIKENSKFVDENGYRLATSITINKQGNRIIGGHQRIKALKELGQDWIDSSDITWVDVEPNSAKEKALNISLNNGNASGKFDELKLKELIADIEKENVDIVEKTITDIKIDKTEVEQYVNNKEAIDNNVSKSTSNLLKKDKGGQFILVYINEEEKKFWMDKFRLTSDKMNWSVDDVK